jgi:hypothetical protein
MGFSSDANSHPVIVRVAGLPADVMAPFSSELGRLHLDEILRLDNELLLARSAMVERLHSAIHGASPETRRLLLAVKRDCFNGRDLRAYVGKPAGLLAREVAGALLEQIAELEERREGVLRDFERSYSRQQIRERNALVALLDEPGFLRGMTLGSLVLVEQLPRLARTPPDSYGRREKRLQASLLRYASRTALKLSPFSSLTRIGLGKVMELAEDCGFDLVDPQRLQERSVVCLRRFLIDQLVDILSSYPAFRQTLIVKYNDTVERLDDGRYRFLSPGHWELDPESSEIRHVKPAVVKVRLEGPLPSWLEHHPRVGRWTYQGLLSHLFEAFSDRETEGLKSSLDALFRIGLLSFLPPWPSDELHPEGRILEHLRSLSRDRGIARLSEQFEEIFELLQAFPRSASPVRSVMEGKRLTEEMMTTAVSLTSATRSLQFKPSDYYFLEDVFLAPEKQRGPSEAFRISEAQAGNVLYNLEPLARLSNLDSSRHDFLHNLAAFAADRWPDQQEVVFTDFFNTAQPLFQEYIRFEARYRGEPALLAPGFNPMKLGEVDRLCAWRKVVSEGLGDCIEAEGEEQRIHLDAFSHLLDRVPGPYARPRDFCAFVQPLDDAGSLWVLNRLFEGAGRLSSRYTPLMDETTRRFWTSYFTERSVFLEDDEPVELVDLFCPAGHTINVHAPQTQRILEIPSETSSLPEERRLRLRDLRVRLCGRDRAPQLTDASGMRLLPIHLGGLVFRFMPNLFKFLAIFGPGEFRYCLPRRNGQRVLDTTVFSRHRMGSVVIVRKTWIFDPAELRERLQGASETAAFALIHRWRSERGIPDRIFLIEPLAAGVLVPRKKPQYIDFTSPALVDIFRGVISSDFKELSLTEALPGPEHLARAEDGRRWAVEVQLDNFGLTPAVSVPSIYHCPPVVEREMSHQQP